MPQSDGWARNEGKGNGEIKGFRVRVYFLSHYFVRS